MLHEAARRSVFRLWLRAFAGIVAVVCAAPSTRASGPVETVQLFPSAPFSQLVEGRTPKRVFATENGVYELDESAKAVRVWQRTGDGVELLFVTNGAAEMTPMTEEQVQYSSPKPQRFQGVDSTGAGTTFNQPTGLAKHPTENRFAVVSGGKYEEERLLKNIPSIQVYAFTENAPDGTDGVPVLGSLSVSLEAEYHEAFFTTTNGMDMVLVGYTNIVTITGTNCIDGISSNWVYCSYSDDWPPELLLSISDWDKPKRPENQELLDSGKPFKVYEIHRKSKDDPIVLPDELQPEEGSEYPVKLIIEHLDATTNVESVARYEYRPTNISTNSSYLSSATDVAFLGGAGFVVPISDCGYSEEFNDKQWDTDHWVTVVHDVSGLVVFDAEDPSRAGLVFPCATNLPGKIAGIDVDQTTGDIYVAVPEAAAVYRYNAPTPNDVSSWLTLADRTVITQDVSFVAGLPSMPGDGPDRLSGPEDVSLWRPDGGSPILLVADRANDRVAAFDPVNLTWSATNWLGETYRPPVSAGAVVDPDPLLGNAVSTNTVPVRRLLPDGLTWTTVYETRVATNWFRIVKTAFPLFTVEDAAHPLNKPYGVFGQDGTNVLAVADGAGLEVRLYGVDVPALSQLYSGDIRSFAVYWPGVEAGFPELSARDLFPASDSAGRPIAFWDAPHASPSAAPLFVAMESDDGTNVLAFTVDPSRSDRTYTLSVSPADGVVSVLSATATVPAGTTTGTFSFLARDGVESVETNVVLWATNAAPDGVVVRFATNEWCDAVAFAETNVFRATPLYTAAVASEDGSFSTNVSLVVANVSPVVTNALFHGYVKQGFPDFGIPAEIYVYGLGAVAADVEADADLTYLWWATTNVNWAAKNLFWAVTNNGWAAGAPAKWTYYRDPGAEIAADGVTNWTPWATANYDAEEDSYYEINDYAGMAVTNWVTWNTGHWDVQSESYYYVVTNWASFFEPLTMTATDGAAVKGIDLYVARGLSVPLPFGYNMPNGPYLGYKGLSPGASWGTTRFVVVCTVLDKDGGATVVPYPQKKGSADFNADWAWDGRNVSSYPFEGVSEDPVVGARYKARFIAVSENNVVFEVWVDSGSPATADQLVLQAAPAVTGAWSRLRDVPAGLQLKEVPAGIATNDMQTTSSDPVRFFRIVQP